MPGGLDETRQILEWIARELGPETYVNLMDQYYPAGKVNGTTFPEINRRLTSSEFQEALRLGFPQWHGLAAVLVGEAYRRSGRLGDAAAAARTGIEVATRAQYWYAVAMAERVAARVARDEGRLDEAADGFELAARTFDRIGTRFEAERTRAESASAKSPT